MKLNEIYEILEKWDTSKVHLSSVKESDDRIRVENVIKFKSFADDVEKIPSFDEVVRTIKQTALYLSSSDQITVNRKIFKKIYRLHAKLFAFVEVLRKTLSGNLEQSSECQLVLKLTDPDDLEQMVKTLKSLEAVLSQVLVNETVNGEVKIESLDFSTGEVNINVGNHPAMKLVGTISRSAVQVCQKMREGRFIYDYIQDLNVKEQSLLDVNNGHDKAIQDLVDQETEKAVQEYFGREKNANQCNNLKIAISRFAELFDQGTQILPARNVPEKVRRLFPNLKKIQAAKSQIKLVPEAA